MKTTKLISISLLTLSAALPGVAMAASQGDGTSHIVTTQSKQSPLQRDAVLMAIESATTNGTFNAVAGDSTPAPLAGPAGKASKGTATMSRGYIQHMGDAT